MMATMVYGEDTALRHVHACHILAGHYSDAWSHFLLPGCANFSYEMKIWVGMVRVNRSWGYECVAGVRKYFFP